MYCVPPRHTTPTDRKPSIVLAANSSNNGSAASSSSSNLATVTVTSSSAAAAALAAHGRRSQPTGSGSAPTLRTVGSGSGFVFDQLQQSSNDGFAAAAAGSSSSLNMMMISGAKTGEEKYVSATEVRRPQDENAAAADAQARRVNRATAGASTEADRIRKLEQELRKSQELVRKKAAELEAANAKNKQAVADLAAKHDRERLDALEAQKQQHDAAAKALLLQVDSLTGQVGRLNGELKQRTAEDNEASRRRESELAASTTLWASERQMMQAELEKLRKQLQEEKDKNGRLTGELRGAKTELETARGDWARLEQQLRTELAAAQREIRELRATVEQQRDNVEAWEKRVNSCNSFILRICQPKFSVVKDDEKLTPMSQQEAAAAAGSGGASGFVLVPLTLMLDAYELLPRDAKQTIATKYEEDKRSRAM